VGTRDHVQVLQTHLSEARNLARSGRGDEALSRVEAALALDPDFVAAQVLREQILASCGPAAPHLRTVERSAPDELDPIGPRPLVSVEAFARFEQRARERRILHRLQAARAAADLGRFDEARSALFEARELDPHNAGALTLQRQLEAAERRRASTTPADPSRRVGPRIVAAAALAGMALAASWLGTTDFLRSYLTADVAKLPPSPAPSQAQPGKTAAAPVSPTELVDIAGTDFRVPAFVEEAPASSQPADAATGPVSTSGGASNATAEPPAAPGAPLIPEAPTPVAVLEPPVEPPIRRSPPVPELLTLGAAPAALPGEPAPASALVPAPSSRIGSGEPIAVPVTPVTSATPVIPLISDEQGVRDALQRYQLAYDHLDAGAARAIWPAVDAQALARAFDGLLSQTLTFDACAVQIRGITASATCRGSARYVPKVGTRETRLEPRVWSFTFRRDGADWRIENARAERGVTGR
jgi:hypothetical protein